MATVKNENIPVTPTEVQVCKPLESIRTESILKATGY
jgi:hypothetical protein